MPSRRAGAGEGSRVGIAGIARHADTVVVARIGIAGINGDIAFRPGEAGRARAGVVEQSLGRASAAVLTGTPGAWIGRIFAGRAAIAFRTGAGKAVRGGRAGAAVLAGIAFAEIHTCACLRVAHGPRIANDGLARGACAALTGIACGAGIAIVTRGTIASGLTSALQRRLTIYALGSIEGKQILQTQRQLIGR